MKPLRHFTVVIAISCVLFAACKKESKTGEQPGAEPGSQTSLQQAVATNPQFSQLSSALLAKGQSLVPNSSYAIGITDEGYLNAVEQMSSVEPTPCDGNTALWAWLRQEQADWTQQLFDYATGIGLVRIPDFYAYLFENSSANQYFGLNGEYTQRLTKTFKDLKRFWNINSDGMVMVGMHGSTLRDREKLIKSYKALYGLSPSDAEIYADFVLYLLTTFPQYRNGDHPLFTFNAGAVFAFDAGSYGMIPNKIIMGDGLLQDLAGIGFGDVGPEAILGHEFGHHVEAQLGLYSNPTSETVRNMELMADALSAYYLSHARGAAMQWKRVQLFLQVFFNEGDCQFTNPGHHGTPTQRMAAAQWAYNLANNAQPQGQILTAQAFAALFQAQLPELITH